MELSWSTFILEIINFLVLVWILKRFLYRPVLDALENRRQKIQQSLSESSERHEQALALEQQYQGRLDEWEREKQQAREALQVEIRDERASRLQQLQAELEGEREKARVIEQRRQAEINTQYQQRAHQQAARFAGKLLSALAGPELESRLFDMLVNQLKALSDDDIGNLRNACRESTEPLTVTSAYALSKDQKQQLQQALSELGLHRVEITWNQDPHLIAGVRIVLGAWVMRFNLHDCLLYTSPSPRD